MWWLLVITLITGALRIPGLNHVPPELFGDEVDVGYQAYSLFKTGKDLYGQILPTYIKSLSEARAPLLMYATVPTIAIFGNNEWGVRLPSAILGTLAPLILFLLIKKSFVSWDLRFGICASAMLAMLPWHIHYSRAAFEVVLMLNLIMLGTILFLKKHYALSIMHLTLAMYAYSTAVLFVPLWLMALVLYTKIKPSWSSLLLLTVTVTPLIYNVVAGPARGRFGLLSVFNDKGMLDTITNLRKNSSPILGKLMHNKWESSFNFLASNYLRAFSTEFLFVRGDPAYRHSIQIVGGLLPLSAPFLLLGLIQLIKQKIYLWLMWLALAPIPAMLTNDGGYHATRLFLMIPPLAVALGLGLNVIKNRLFLGICILVIAAQLGGVGYYYVVHYPKLSWRWWHVGFKQAMTYVASNKNSYDKVFINNTYEPSLIRFLFWTKYSPRDFQQQFVLDQNSENIIPGYDGFKLTDKYYFGTFNKNKIYYPNSLYLLSARDEGAANMRILQTINNSFGDPLFYIATHD